MKGFMPYTLKYMANNSSVFRLSNHQTHHVLSHFPRPCRRIGKKRIEYGLYAVYANKMFNRLSKTTEISHDKSSPFHRLAKTAQLSDKVSTDIEVIFVDKKNPTTAF
ncbi:hypothetical protein V2I52_08440 [Brenneria sp. g21c3]|uniref:hypothetical protein n=1 Tax=Brenneria sp. g21c3 TaxID=3093893 RepID=UPI002EA9B321|nr:hypothetical protein [Brenneria sp. g21c3]